MASDLSTCSFWSLSFSELEAEIIQAGINAAHTKALFRALHRKPSDLEASGETLSPPLKKWIDEQRMRLNPVVSVDQEIISEDGFTRKWLLRLYDDETIETVLMSYQGRFTVCISSQVGCAMGCVFCATGQSGFTRHLSTAEIVGQVLFVQRFLQSSDAKGLRNIVLMGMGEPLHNYDAVMKALSIISDTRGLNIGPSRISVSTVGVVPGILRMAEEDVPYNLAVSLHGANESDRSELVPVSKKWSLAELMKACRTYTLKTERRIFFEWTLISGKNDSEAQASELAYLLSGMDAHINLIPLNPTQDYAGSPTQSLSVDLFQKTLRDKGFPCTIRQRRGIDVAAGCGQLRKQDVLKVI